MDKAAGHHTAADVDVTLDQDAAWYPEPHETLLEIIPDSILQANIFPLLYPHDRKSVRSLCSRSRDLINSSVTAVRVTPDLSGGHGPGRLSERFPNLQEVHAYDDGESPWTDELLMEFLGGPLLRGVTFVNLKQCHYVSRRLLHFLNKHCPNLRRLDPSRWVDNCTLWMLQQFEGLRHLELGDNDVDIIAVDDVGLSAVAAVTGLTSLSLQRCRWISDNACVTLARLAHLQHLDMSNTDITGRGLPWLASLPGLQSLNLSDCKNFDDDGLERAASLTSLHSLQLRNTAVTNTGLLHVRKMRWLKSLDLGPRFELNDEGMQALASCAQLTELLAGSFNLARPPPPGFNSLRHLQFGGMYPSKGLRRLFPLPRLASLKVQGIDAVTDGVMRQVSSQTSLEKLALSGGYQLSSVGLNALSSLTGLVSLSLSACPNVTATALQTFVSAHERLSQLLVDCCPQVAAAAGASGPCSPGELSPVNSVNNLGPLTCLLA